MVPVAIGERQAAPRQPRLAVLTCREFKVLPALEDDQALVVVAGVGPAEDALRPGVGALHPEFDGNVRLPIQHRVRQHHEIIAAIKVQGPARHDRRLRCAIRGHVNRHRCGTIPPVRYDGQRVIQQNPALVHLRPGAMGHQQFVPHVHPTQCEINRQCHAITDCCCGYGLADRVGIEKIRQAGTRILPGNQHVHIHRATHATFSRPLDDQMPDHAPRLPVIGTGPANRRDVLPPVHIADRVPYFSCENCRRLIINSRPPPAATIPAIIPHQAVATRLIPGVRRPQCTAPHKRVLPCRPPERARMWIAEEGVV